MTSCRNILLAACLLAATSLCFADEAGELRRKLPSLQGEARLEAYGELYQLSKATGDVAEQHRCLGELLAEARRQGDQEREAGALMERAVFFYNNDMNDSVFHYVPQDLETLRRYEDWARYYNMWTYLSNTYIYTGASEEGLNQVNAMYEDAKRRNSDYGMGLAYAGMGVAYSMMGNLEESAEAYRKGIALLQDLNPPSPTVLDMYSDYGDMLNNLKQYSRLDSLAAPWNAFLRKYMEKRNIPADGPSANISWSYYYTARLQASLGLGRLDEAKRAIDEIAKRISNEEDYIGQTYLFYLAQYYLQTGDYREALRVNTRRTELMMETDDKSVYIMVRQQRAEILKNLGQYEEAARLYEYIYHYNDSLNKAETKKQLNDMNTRYQLDEVKMKQERERLQGLIALAAFVVLALAVFLVFRIRAARRLKQAHQELEAAHDKLLTAYDQLEETTTAKERIESELRIARDIQMGMVPSQFPERPDVDLYASMTPAKEVGGDLYDFFILDDRLYFALGDVSGKGVPASLFMSQATRLFRALAKQQLAPADIATRMNDELSENNDNGMFVTMFLGVADLKSGHLDFCNAGHNPPVVGNDSHATPVAYRFLEMEPNAPIGLWPGLQYEGESVDDVSGCPFFIYTDGLNEAENRQQEQFSDERLLELLQSTPFESARQVIELLREEVTKHRDGAEPNDDLTMMCFKIAGNQQTE